MGREPGWGAVMTGRPPMRSPGRPPVAHKEHRRLFWTAISQGATSTDAGLAAGVSEVVGTRWFRECGGVKPQSVFHVDSGRYLSFAEREQIALWRAEKMGVRQIARTAESLAVDGVTRTAAKREHPRRNIDISGDGGAMAPRPARRPPQAGENGRQPTPTPIRTGTPGRSSDHRARRHGDRSDGAVHRPQSCPTRRPAVGTGLEPGADRGPTAARLPGRSDDADLARGDLPGALHRGPGSVVPRVRRLPTDRACAAGTARADPPRTTQPTRLHHPRGHPRPPPRRGRRSAGARTLGGRPHHRAEPVRDRHTRRTNHSIHHSAAASTHGRIRNPGPREERTRTRRSRRRSRQRTPSSRRSHSCPRSFGKP